MRGNFLFYALALILLIAGSFFVAFTYYVFIRPATRMTIYVTDQLTEPFDRIAIETAQEYNTPTAVEVAKVIQHREDKNTWYAQAKEIAMDEDNHNVVAVWLIFMGALVFVLAVMHNDAFKR